MNLVSFRDFLKLLDCSLPELNKLPGEWNVLPLLGTSCLKELPSIMKGFVSEEIATLQKVEEKRKCFQVSEDFRW